MILAIYGISRCGKDYLIDKVIERLNGKAIHFYGSNTLKELSKKLYDLDFNNLTIEQQIILREKFVEKVKEEEKKYKNIIIDGHYSFPNNEGGFDIVFTKADKYLYDEFIYINKSAKFIIDNFMNSNKKQWKSYLDNEEKINEWKEFEINHLKIACKELDKELIIIDDDTSCSVDFISDFITYNNKLLSNKIVDEVMKRISIKIIKYNSIVLLDCDKTVSINDLTYDFCEKGGLERSTLKSIFYGDYYTIYQFYRFQQYLSKSINYNESIIYAAEKVLLNNCLINDLTENKGNTYFIGITTGIVDAWNYINNENEIFDLLIGIGKLSEDKLLRTFVTPSVKYQLTKRLKELGKKIISIGDSIIDIPMLEEANKGIVVAMDKLNKKVSEYISSNINNQLYQLAYNKFKYEGLREIKSIW